ncbi:Bromodomain-containing protein [Coniochaeta sp. PMI_546]|nr:Bromodomain-containing protein [Coniochaeta sp. PMI_546]
MSDDGRNGEPAVAGTIKAPEFSWLKPHPEFVIILVGPDEEPFGIQLNFLCARSEYYRQYFLDPQNRDGSIERIVKIPDTIPEVFGYVQNYMFTGQVFPNLDHMPSYEVLIGVWKLGWNLKIEGLCDATLEAMAECRRITQRIPATPLLVQVWQDTPEGSTIRKLLLSWAAEYMRSSESRAEFARSLPQEVLSELVVAMSSLDSPPVVQVNNSAPATQPLPRAGAVHYITGDDDADEQGHASKKQRRQTDGLPRPMTAAVSKIATAKKPGPRASMPNPKPPVRRRGGAAAANPANHTTAQKLNFCADLLTRMLSGPGFWTRLVGPFKEPVDPVQDGVPDYFDKVTKPMDLGTMKGKMDRGEYTNEEEFLNDMNQIFSNCYTYWSKKDPMWAACEKLQKSFEDKYSNMNRWIAKMEGDEDQ